MASAIDIKITLDGKTLEGFTTLSVRQDIFSFQTFEVHCRFDAFDRFSASAESFVIEKAQHYIGKKIKIEIVHLQKNGAVSKSSTVFRGIVLEVEGLKYHDAYSGTIVFSGASPDVFFNSDHHCRSFIDKSLDDIVKSVIHGYSTSLFDKTSVSSRHSAAIPYIVQYNETNLAFLQRLAKRYGEWFLTTADNHLFFGSPPEKNADLTHGIDLHEFSFSMKLHTLDYQYAAYDYFKEDNVVKSSQSHQPSTESYLKNAYNSSEDTLNEKEEFFYNLPLTKGKSDQEIDDAVKTDKLGRVSGLTLAKGTSDNSELTVGGTVRIKGIVDSGSSRKTTDYGEYRIITLYHSCDEAGNYLNHFEAIPASLESPPNTSPFLVPVCETQCATVIDTDDPEGIGRVKVRFHWQSPQEETPWLRVVTPYAGNNKGIFFIPETGEEVLVAFEGNNAEKPYVAGAHYNGKKKPDDWKSDKNIKKGIRTRSGHTIEFNDDKGNEEIIIYDKDKINTVTLSSHGKLMTIDCQGDLKIHAQNINIKAEKDYKLESRGKIEMESHRDTSVKAITNIQIKSNKDIEIEAMMNLKGKSNIKTELSGTMLTASGTATAELSSGAQTVVKGAVVKIN
jgi:type VI secretion system secreted protein VgrG